MKKHIHLIGIGGTGLSAIARLLHESGYAVSGSDQTMSPLADALVKDGIRVIIGHRAENIAGADMIVRSSAISDENPEVVAANTNHIPVLKRSDFLGQLMEKHTSIAVAGTHGKTTTTGLIAWMLSAMGLDPSYIVGGTVNQLGTNAHAGKGVHFVIEADEYDRMFLGLKPDISLITSMELDHPDCFPTLAEYNGAFLQFASSTRPGGTLLVCGDHANLRELATKISSKGIMTSTYGVSTDCDYQATSIQLSETGVYQFDLARKTTTDAETLVSNIFLTIPGKHNLVNALAALSVADQLGLDLITSASHVSSFTGTGRRFEIVAEVNGIILIDDYAHHPTEIKTTLAAVRSRYQSARIFAIWQPHTYSRTRLLRDQFVQSFSDANQTIVTEIYASREPKEAFSSIELVNLMNSSKTRFIPDLHAVTETLLKELRPGDVVIVLSAGDANQINADLANALKGQTL
ncbi:MAG: UDP-N-acetylmuramate--L-alanine ligase [Anaerolinea sp.]|nr:UDP-N-acetylmuramate--L-alanine ligase [Anaerolinea sp.]